MKSDDTNLGLKTSHEVDEKRMPYFIGNFEDVSFRHEAFHLVTCNDVTFLQSFDRKVFTGRFILC